jgi:hypothetical protein
MRRIGDNARMDRPSRAAAAPGSRETAGDDALNDQALFWAALSYAAAADAYVANDPWYAPGPVLSLLGRALELALKAYAVHTGAVADTLRYQIGSDLEACLRYALDHGLVVRDGVRDEDRASLRKLNAYCQLKRTDFPELTVDDPPAARVIRELLNRVLAGTFIPIWDVGTYRTKASAATTPGLTIDPRANYRQADPPERPATRAPVSESSD